MEQHARLLVRCPHCELKQYEGAKCRRCKQLLPEPVVNYVMQAEEPVCREISELLPLEEIKRRAIVYAMHHSTSVVEAAARLKIGKTTLYRMLQYYGIERLQKTKAAKRKRR